uniref:Arrestin-like N-terminal domain-containing protein n=1 Tax=Musca domestica TaxID=7370 RepID=A0A1I8MVW2_MUSDO
MSILCKFELTRASSIYYSGEVVEGHVTLNLLKQRQIEAILLEFYGQTKLEWLDLDKTSMADQIVHNDFSSKELHSMKTLYTNSHKHVCELLELASNNQQQQQQILHPHVEYRYKFRFPIPVHAAATSRCPLGECEYGLRLIVQHPRKVNKEFHQRIVIKNKLDLSENIELREPFTVQQQNSDNDEGIILTTPCTGFTPGQKVPYHIKCKTSQPNCKILVQLNCQITAVGRSQTPCADPVAIKQAKQIINRRKHLPTEIMAYLNLPLDCQIARGPERCEDSMLRYEYLLEAFLIDGCKKILASVAIPLTIGTTPCLEMKMMEEDFEDVICYDNYESSHEEPVTTPLNLTIPSVEYFIGDHVYKSMCELMPLKRNKSLRRSLRYCYKKFVKLI